VLDNPSKPFEYGPNLDIIPNASAAYEEEMVENPKNRDHIETAHRNFLRDAVFMLYMYDQQKDASKWYKYLAEKYPDKPVLLTQANSFPRNVNLTDYAMSRLEEELGSPGQDKIKGIIEGLETMSFRSMVIGDDGHAAGLDRLAQDLWVRYSKKIDVGSNEVAKEKTLNRIGIPSMPSFKLEILNKLLDNWPPEMAAILATKTGQKWPRTKTNDPSIITAPPPAGTNSPPPPTNALPPGTLF